MKEHAQGPSTSLWQRQLHTQVSVARLLAGLSAADH